MSENGILQKLRNSGPDTLPYLINELEFELEKLVGMAERSGRAVEVAVNRLKYLKNKGDVDFKTLNTVVDTTLVEIEQLMAPTE